MYYGWRSEVATASGRAVYRWKLFGSEETVDVNFVSESNEVVHVRLSSFSDTYVVGELGDFVKLVSTPTLDEAALDELEPADTLVPDGIRAFFGNGLV